MTTLWIMLGSALGGAARYWCSLVAAQRIGEAFPWGTLLVNVVGSFIIGGFTALTGAGGRFPLGVDARLFVTTGFCGGYTTFSAFSLQTLALFQQGETARAAANVAASVLLCLLAVWIGYMAGQRV